MFQSVVSAATAVWALCGGEGGGRRVMQQGSDSPSSDYVPPTLF
jgi:hypothetical protein